MVSGFDFFLLKFNLLATLHSVLGAKIKVLDIFQCSVWFNKGFNKELLISENKFISIVAIYKIQ